MLNMATGLTDSETFFMMSRCGALPFLTYHNGATSFALLGLGPYMMRSALVRIEFVKNLCAIPSTRSINCQLFVLRNQFSFPQNERIINRILPTVHQSHLFRQGDKNEVEFRHWIHSTTIFVIYSPSQRRIREMHIKIKWNETGSGL